MIRIEGVCKSYGTVEALKDVHLEVSPGEVYGLLGANGSGKTTLNRCIATLIQPDAGCIEVAGHSVTESPEDVRRSLGYLSEFPVLYPGLSADEFLAFVGGIRALSDEAIKTQRDRWIALFELEEFRRAPLRSFSQGMARKVALAASLLGDPQVVLLDEPTNGLDPPSVYLFRQVIAQLKAEGKAVLLSSHVLPLVEQSCDRIGILADGKVAVTGDLRHLQTTAGKPQADLEELFLHFSGLDRVMLERLAVAGLPGQ
ncbi:MAG TPA: 3-dehydroquinate dehydratase [Deltaproteobacteria bacterium]|nr:3-dehydroquinate dehydratase [Deltaproteobacteria bacterium]HCP44721.1 3-dehydroquinate dehydratase [Deltaproteobacteria bacterium]